MIKPYVELACDNVAVISDKIYRCLAPIDSYKFGWNFVDINTILDNGPELRDFFKQYKLVPLHAAITLVADDTHLPQHIDELPVVAKVNFPVHNTQGWANRWYENDLMIGEVLDMPLPLAFNSQIAHSVERTYAAEVPRIVASFTFKNDPVRLLK
jgi:hypothetical protein